MVVQASLAALAAFAVLSPAVTHSHAIEKLQPSEEVSIQRGPQIFNAVHNAMRQWGSSLHHNGMSFFLATVPEGVLFHHGNSRPESPAEPDWLAYEVEHAEGFARGRRRRPGDPPRHDHPGKYHDPDGDFHRLQVDDTGQKPIRDVDSSPLGDDSHGYLHVYRTSQQLHYLYVDGMGGGKTTLGCLDSQDYLLRGEKTSKEDKEVSDTMGGGPMNERQRAIDLCELSKQWNLQGVIRMEAGFEIIQCDFSDGLDQIQALQRADSGNEGIHGVRLEDFELIRGVSERYHGIGSRRTVIDYSSMVSAFFFPINLTNPDPKRPELPRLLNASDAQLAAIKTYLSNMVEQRRGAHLRTIDWQDVTDLIVGRFADRLKFLVEKVDTVDTIAKEISFLLDVYIDYSDADKGLNFSVAKDRCSDYYLRSITPVTEADHMIHVAFKAVTSRICSALFEVRELVIDNSHADHVFVKSVDTLKALMEFLQWARFKQCSACAIDEVCTIPMWPYGSTEDHYNPRCRNASNILGSDNYWHSFQGQA